MKILIRVEYTLDKKHSSIDCNEVRWGVATGMVTIGCIDTK